MLRLALERDLIVAAERVRLDSLAQSVEPAKTPCRKRRLTQFLP